MNRSTKSCQPYFFYENSIHLRDFNTDVSDKTGDYKNA